MTEAAVYNEWVFEPVATMREQVVSLTVMDQVEGVVPNDRPPYHQGGWVFELSPADRSALWWNGLEAMARVHRLDASDSAFAFLPQPESGRSPIEAQLDDYEECPIEEHRYFHPLLPVPRKFLLHNFLLPLLSHCCFLR